jgi:hypothetical protein
LHLTREGELFLERRHWQGDRLGTADSGAWP